MSQDRALAYAIDEITEIATDLDWILSDEI